MDLYTNLVKLAQENPTVRAHLLPILREYAPKVARSSKWLPLEGPALNKIKRMFKAPVAPWYVYHKKIMGKSIFLRDHGVITLYVAGADGYAYSWKSNSGMDYFNDRERDLAMLVNTAITGEIPERNPGIYRNAPI